MSARRVALVLAVLALALAIALSARTAPPSDSERVDAIAAELRCPVCQGLSVRDSPSETARQMRDLVAQRVREGRGDDQIRDEFRRSYGDWVLLSPPAGGWTGLVWALPILLVAGGFVVAGGALRRSKGTTATGAAATPAQLAALRERAASEDAE
jgi:cytochrome c-type biogenesis protein CcmH